MSAKSFQAEINPKVLINKGVCGLRIRNHSKYSLILDVYIDNVSKAKLSFEAFSDRVQMAAGKKGGLCVRVRAKKRPLIGIPKKLSFNIHIRASCGQIECLAGELWIQPWLPYWMPIIMTGLSIGIWMLI